jgi:hypothetical protein
MSLVREDSKINVEITTNSAGVYVVLVKSTETFFREVCKRQI